MAGTPDDSLCYLPQPRVTKGLFDAKPQPGTGEVRVALTRVNNWSLLKILYIAITAVLQIKKVKRISPGFSTGVLWLICLSSVGSCLLCQLA